MDIGDLEIEISQDNDIDHCWNDALNCMAERISKELVDIASSCIKQWVIGGGEYQVVNIRDKLEIFYMGLHEKGSRFVHVYMTANPQKYKERVDTIKAFIAAADVGSAN